MDAVLEPKAGKPGWHEIDLALCQMQSHHSGGQE